METKVLKSNGQHAFFCSASQAIALLIGGYATLNCAVPLTITLMRKNPPEQAAPVDISSPLSPLLTNTVSA